MAKLKIWDGDAWEQIPDPAEIDGAVAAAIDAEPRIAQLVTDVAAVDTRVDDVEPAAFTSKDRVLDLADYVDITGTSDSTSGFQQAINDAQGRSLFLRAKSTVKLQAGELYIPDADRFQFVMVGDGIAGSRLEFTGTGPAFQMDPNTTPASGTRRQRMRMENMYIVGPGKATSGSVGLHVNNALLGYFANITVEGFETGIHVDGHNLANGAAAYYNDFYKVSAAACGTAIYVSGQANSNRFFGGSARLSEIGVHLEGANNVVFNGTDIEVNSVVGARIDAYGNHFLGVRLENSGASYDVEFLDTSGTGARGRKNVIVAYWQSTNPSARISWVSGPQDNIVQYPGMWEMGDANSSVQPYAMHVTRSASADAKPLVLAEDTYSSSGSPDGFVYQSARLTSRPFVWQDGSGNDRFVISRNSSGQPYIEMTNSSSLTTAIRTYHLDPNTRIVGNIGDIILRTGSGGGLYAKETDDGLNTGWVKK